MSALWGEAEGADRQTPLNSVENDPKRTLEGAGVLSSSYAQ